MSTTHDLISADLDGIDPAVMAEHFRAVVSLTDQQLSGMLGYAQQRQADDVYYVAHAMTAARAEDAAMIAAAPQPQPFPPGESPF